MGDEKASFGSDKNKAKKRISILVASIFTFAVFLGWVFYFVNNTKENLFEADNSFAIFESLKENTLNAFVEIGEEKDVLLEKINSDIVSLKENTASTSTSTLETSAGELEN